MERSAWASWRICLQSHAAHFLVERFVDFSHAAAPKQPDNLEAVKDDFTGMKCRLSRRVARSYKRPVVRTRLIVGLQYRFELCRQGFALFCVHLL